MSTPLKRINTCIVCGKEFHPFNKEQKTCELACYNTIRSKNRRSRTVHTCAVCGKEFEYKAYRDAKYCSKACWSVRNPPRPRKCAACGKEFNSKDKNAGFCSRRCGGLLRVGAHAGNWKGGKSAQTRRGKMRGELKKWRERVYLRDNYTCKKCGKRGVELHAHHVKPFAQYPELATDIDNGMTLCVECHETIHGKKLARYKRSITKSGNASLIR